MAPRPKKAEQKPEFPPECRGVCKFAEPGDPWLCWGCPPLLSQADGETVFNRGAPIDPMWRICAFFKPRLHA